MQSAGKALRLWQAWWYLSHDRHSKMVQIASFRLAVATGMASGQARVTYATLTIAQPPLELRPLHTNHTGHSIQKHSWALEWVAIRLEARRRRFAQYTRCSQRANWRLQCGRIDMVDVQPKHIHVQKGNRTKKHAPSTQRSVFSSSPKPAMTVG
jgi:hypothetical protein